MKKLLRSVMKKLLPLLVFVLLPGCWWFSISAKKIKGSGNRAIELKEIKAASELEISGSGLVIFTQGEPASLSIECDDNFVPYINVDADDDDLSIEIDKAVQLQPVIPIVYTLMLPKLEQIELQGAIAFKTGMIKGEKLTLELTGANRIDATLNVQKLEIESTGASKINLEGRVHKQEVELTGATHYNAGQLKSEECEIDLSGATRATVHVLDRLKVIADGAAFVAYTGDPKVIEKLSGSASVKKVG